MTDSLISNDSNTNDNFDENQDHLSLLTGPGGKYDRTKYNSDEEMYKAIARGKVEADNLIKIKNNQYDDLHKDFTHMRDTATTQAKLQELLDKIENRKSTPSNDDDTEDRGEDKQPNFKPEDIESLVSKKIAESKIVEKQTENFNKVQAKLRDMFAHNVSTALTEKYTTLGISPEDGDALARKSPDAFFNLLGLNEPTRKENFDAPPKSRLMGTMSTSPTSTKRTWSYYQDLKKNNPEAYLQPQTAVQMQKDYNELGSAFEDGDFHRFGD